MHDQVELPSGVKHDSGKVRLELLAPYAIEEMSKVMTFGAKKYGDSNWRNGLAWSRVIGALLRHVFAYLRREDVDPETGINHMAHAMCCCMFLLEYSKTHVELDDRYKHETNETHRNQPLAF